jgi:hypothetical protein
VEVPLRKQGSLFKRNGLCTPSYSVTPHFLYLFPHFIRFLSAYPMALSACPFKIVQNSQMNPGKIVQTC